jgi:hypothetical protein
VHKKTWACYSYLYENQRTLIWLFIQNNQLSLILINNIKLKKTSGSMIFNVQSLHGTKELRKTNLLVLKVPRLSIIYSCIVL